VIQDVLAAWTSFCNHAESREAAGEAIFSALFEGAPSFQSMFVTPRAIQAMRFMSGLDMFVSGLHSPEQLRIAVETLGFGHLNKDVTVPRVVIFRDAILELFDVELGDAFTARARDGWKRMLNYIGGGIIFTRRYYAARLRLLEESWHQASGKALQEHLRQQQLLAKSSVGRSLGRGGSMDSGQSPSNGSGDLSAPPQEEEQRSSRKGFFSAMRKIARRRSSDGDGGGGGDGGSSPLGGGASPRSLTSPRSNDNEFTDGGGKLQAGGIKVKANMTYDEMFELNLAMKGLQKRRWLLEVMACWDKIVVNVANSSRLQQECEILALRITKCQQQDGSSSSAVKLDDYKTCMLASLRSVLPKVWDSDYEVAWNWLWANVERKLLDLLGHPETWEVALARLFQGFTDQDTYNIRKSIYENFFAAAPVGQDWFKQSNTRLHFIADRALCMTREILADPWQMVDDLSALGLRHVGYGIPTELIGPFVTSCIQVISSTTDDQTALEAFRWSLGLISKLLVETINEGSTIVMKAINVNSESMLRKAVSCAPRGKRAQWVLMVQVGSQNISPLLWALQSGSLEAAEAIITDLLTIRADRRSYYYGMEELFQRHPDIIARLCKEGQSMVKTLLDGLVWRSRLVHNGVRRANYYVKYLIVDQENGFADALHHLAGTQDPQLMCEPVVTHVSNTLWSGLVQWQFIVSKMWFLISLLIFMLNQAILPKTHGYRSVETQAAVFVCRVLTYLLTMGRLLLTNIREIITSYRTGRVTRLRRIPVPSYIFDPYEAGSLVMALLLVAMLCIEPFLWCAASGEIPVEECPASERTIWLYSLFAMWAMLLHWFLIIDLAVFSTGLSAFVLVCVHVLSEIALFLVALVFCLLSFASAISVLEHDYESMQSVMGSAVTLFSIMVNIFEDDYRNFQGNDVLLIMVFGFIVASAILLLNLLIAQLNCSYVYVYQNMVGFARMKRAQVIVQTLGEDMPHAKWDKFIQTLGLEDPLEFNSGDIGPAGGMTVEEPAGAHTVTTDRVVRFGGTSSPDQPWPEDVKDTPADKFTRLDKLLNKTLKLLAKEPANAGGRDRGKAGGAVGHGGGRRSVSGNMTSSSYITSATAFTTTNSGNGDERASDKFHSN